MPTYQFTSVSEDKLRESLENAKAIKGGPFNICRKLKSLPLHTNPADFNLKTTFMKVTVCFWKWDVTLYMSLSLSARTRIDVWGAAVTYRNVNEISTSVKGWDYQILEPVN